MRVRLGNRHADLIGRVVDDGGRPMPIAVTCRRLEDLALDVIGQAVARNLVEDTIAAHERSHDRRK